MCITTISLYVARLFRSLSLDYVAVSPTIVSHECDLRLSIYIKLFVTSVQNVAFLKLICIMYSTISSFILIKRIHLEMQNISFKCEDRIILINLIQGLFDYLPIAGTGFLFGTGIGLFLLNFHNLFVKRSHRVRHQASNNIRNIS